jgi:hypothetical protein
MIVIIVCFSLAVPVDDQCKQIAYWLNFLNSSLSLPPLSSTPKWSIILAGVREDEQQDLSIIQNPITIQSWKTKWSQLPIYPKVFSVSSLKSTESVQILLQCVEAECGRIFNKNATQIPSSYQAFLLELKNTAKTTPLISWNELFAKFSSEMKMTEMSFKTMLQYLQAIGRIVWLPNGTVFTDPTIAPKIAAKFISPKDIRLALLKEETEVVQILDETQVGSLLHIDTSNNIRYYIIICSNNYTYIYILFISKFKYNIIVIDYLTSLNFWFT